MNIYLKLGLIVMGIVGLIALLNSKWWKQQIRYVAIGDAIRRGKPIPDCNV